MTITFLLGNGFDLNLGLKTRYRHFYDYYLKQESKNETIADFKKALSDNLENWADLEIELGKYVNNFTKETENQFIDLLYDIQDSLANYLDNQDSVFIISEDDKKKSINDLIKFETYFTPREKADFLSYKNQLNTNSYDINIITFNYTKTFEKIYNWKGATLNIGNRKVGNTVYNDTIKILEHIHGTTTDNMILGVNDSSQIYCDELKQSVRTMRALIKTEMNVNAGTLRDSRCETAIKQSDIICVYGMSLGDTDKVWWKNIGTRIAQSNTRLVIFSRAEQLPTRRAYAGSNYKDEIKECFLNHLAYDEPSKEKLKEKIFVCLNSSMFKVNLDYGTNSEIEATLETEGVLAVKP